MCPSCEQGTLHSTGAFWVCEACGLAITQQALTFARTRRAVPDARKRASGVPASHAPAGVVPDEGEQPRR